MERSSYVMSVHLLLDIVAPRVASRLTYSGHWHGDRLGTGVALTFDDGPVPGSTDRILDELDRLGARATFFVLGSQTRRNPALAREITERGHEIGFHGDSHVDPWRVSAERIAIDFRLGVRIVEDAIGRRPVAFRPPYGHLRPSLSRLASEYGLPIVMWDVLSGDFRRNLDPHRLAASNIRWVTGGSIIVLHDSAGDRALVHLDALLGGIAKKGLSVVPLTSMIS